MPFVDFEELKRSVSFEQTVAMLGLRMKKTGNQLRGPCPRCKTGGERALVVTEGKGFYCFAAQSGGDQIALAAHIKNCAVKDAASFLAGSTAKTQDTVPPAAPEEGKTLQPLSYLESEHAAVIALGFDTEFAKKHGIGYAGKGIARGHVLIPFRDESGRLLGYVGVQDAWLPADFQQPTNVIQLKKA